ncbi:MAG: aldo/keto reductase [Gammaproteobacteria bacterium]|nr:aldo/keto reductase [Gammaproteobacteria bacterium]
MRYRKLGRTDLRVSEIGFGTQTIGGPTLLGKKQVGWGCTDDKTSLAALHACLDHGVTFIDTADVYGWGHAETLVGKAFKHHRDRLVIATKAGYRVGQNGGGFKDYSPGYLKQAVEASLRRLRTDYIDLFQLHSVPDDFEIPEQSLEALEGLREAGKIRYYGASMAKLEMGIPMVEATQIYAIQVEYNLLHEAPARALSPKALERGVGLVVKAPLGTGFLCGKYREPGMRFPADDIRSNMPQAEVIERTFLPTLFRTWGGAI